MMARERALPGKGKKGVKCWNCNSQGHTAKDCPKMKQSSSAVENPTKSPSVTSYATGETSLSAFYLTSNEKRTELNSFESKSSTVLVTGIDSGAARSVVPVGKFPGYPVMRDSESRRVYTSATGDHVIDSGQQQIVGTVDGLAHACGPSSKNISPVFTTCVQLDIETCSTSTATTTM